MESFRIAVPDEELLDLRGRLTATRWPAEIRDEGWEYGIEPAYLRELVSYWATGYDWRRQEAALNELPHYRVSVDGVGIHAVHVPGVGPDPLPLVLSHGWPSSFVEWRRVIGPLTDPARYGGDPADAFTVVAPSLPGYGFSDVPTHRGMSPRRIAELWVGLMEQLGYGRFAAHGCDWGAYVTALLGLEHPGRVVGLHMGMVSLRGNPMAPATGPDVDAFRARARRWRSVEQGYIAIQSTKPHTLAYGLTDSPAGLAAWIAEKWWAWADCGTDLEPVIARDDLLTTISIYWFTRTITSANRLYYESHRDAVRLGPGRRVEVPCGFLLETPEVDRSAVHRQGGVAAAPRPGAPPRARAEEAFRVERWTQTEVGGHFPALEIPEVFVDELRAFFRPLRS